MASQPPRRSGVRPPRLPAAQRGQPAVLRRLNMELVLKAIREEGPMTRADIAKRTQLSKPTINEVVEELVKTGFVKEGPEVVSRPRRPGRPGRTLSFRPGIGHVMGVDIGGDNVLVAVADLTGEVLASERRDLARGVEGPDRVLAEVQHAADACLSTTGLSMSNVRAVAVGTPGMVDPMSGRVTLAPQLKGWEGVRLGARFEALLGCRTLVENEVHLAVMAEQWRGAAQGVDDAFLLQIGVGIGGGVLIGGELLRGANGAAGEVGYIPAVDGEPESGFGSLEWVAGARAYARMGAAVAETSEGARLREVAGGNPADIDAKAVFDAASGQDPAALRIVDELVGRLAQGTAAIVAVLDPEVIVIGGGLSHAGELLLDTLARHLKELVPIAPRLVLSSLGGDAVALGAIRAALNEVNEHLLD